MHKYLIFILFVLAASCQSERVNLQEQIKRVETNLLPATAFKGTSIDRYDMEERMRYYQVPGLSIAFVDDGRIVWARGYGYRSFDSIKKVTPHTLFQAASISKPLAALAALDMVEDSLLKLDRDVNRYLGSWKVPESRFNGQSKVTLRRLMTHTAGLNVHGFPGYRVGDTVPSVVEVLQGSGSANTQAVYPDTVPGVMRSYSGGGYTVMQLMMEEATGKHFAPLMRDRVLNPLGMNSSTYRQPLPEHLKPKAAIAHDGEGKALEGRWHVYPEQAAAGLWTTPSDLARYIVELQKSLGGKSNQVLSREMTGRMLTPHQGGGGLGPFLQGKGDSLVFSHGGANAGYRCHFFAFARKGQGVVLMTNSDNGRSLINEMLRGMDEIYDWNYFPVQRMERILMTGEELAFFEGRYQLRGDIVIEIEAAKDHLVIHTLWNDDSIRFYPSGKRQFFDLNRGWRLYFNTDEAYDSVKGFRLNGEAYFRRQQ